jgi:CRISPR-associated exonuclease Cas4
MMNINATLINLYTVCPRECWLHANGINMEQTSDTVQDGNLLEEITYKQRVDKFSQIELSAKIDDITLTGKIDFFDNKTRTIHETKRGNVVEKAHEQQVKFYIWLFKLNKIEDVSGIIEYPRLRQRTEVFLDFEETKKMVRVVEEISECIQLENCPPRINQKICRSCSYHDFCYSGEEKLSYT